MSEPTEKAGGARRMRACNSRERQEFGDSVRRLLASGVAEEELRSALGYDSVDRVWSAIRTGRITTYRLERLRALARRRLGPDVADPAGVSEREEAGSQTAGAAASPRGAGGRDVRDGSVVGGEAYLTRARHRRLRDQIEHLWALDKRFKSWSLLARVGGVETAQSMKRAYEASALPSTLKNVEMFCRLHAAFGSRATEALQSGVPVEELKGHLMGTGAETVDRAGVGEPGETDRGAPSRGSRGGVERGAGVKATETGTESGGRTERPAVEVGAVVQERRPPARGRKKEHLTEAEHRRLKELIDTLRKRDPRLRTWSLLAKAAGLGSGFAIKRAYDVNSSIHTLRNLEEFAKLYEEHGDAATDALRADVGLADLGRYLAEGGAATGAGEADAKAPAERRPARSRRKGGVAVRARGRAAGKADESFPAVDFEAMFEVGRNLDAEVKRLWIAARFFDEVARHGSLPAIVRHNAGLARDRLESVVSLFAPDGGEE